MALLEANLNGRTIRQLGVTRTITPAVNGATSPIFVVGDVKNRAPEGDTFVAFVVIEFTAPQPGVALTLRLGDSATIATAGDWKDTFDPGDYSGNNPIVLYAADQQNTYPNGVTFSVRTVTNGGAGGTMVVRAYGWTE